MPPIRRRDRALPPEAVWAILDETSHGTLALAGGDFPYAVVLNHAREGQRLVFHCAGEGDKLSRIRADSRACFSAVARAKIDAARQTTYYRSVTVFGHIRLLETNERQAAAEVFMQKLAPGQPYRLDGRVCFLALDIVEGTAKENKGLSSAPG